MPAGTNQYGDIFGGWLLGQMDIAGGIFRGWHCKGKNSNRAVDAMTFLCVPKTLSGFAV
jgi:acyl-CoA thioesterase YciA